MTALLSVKELTISFPVGGVSLLPRRRRVIQAVQDVSFDIAPGETLALVGESGCGKTTAGRATAGLYKAPKGTVSFRGQDIFNLPRASRKPVRRAIQMVFQDPFSSLDPRMTVFEILSEPLKINRMGSAREIRERVQDLIGQVGLPADSLNRYPHEFSGGQRQRIAIARALAPEPELIVADEPLSALDVSVQSQVLNLLGALKRERGLSYLFISHDLAAVHHIADRVAVMYLGRLVEIAGRDALFANPRHPYTQGLLAAVPRIGQGRRKRTLIAGDLPSPLAVPSGCAFHPRCPLAQEICRRERPELKTHSDVAHLTACHFAERKEAA
ncbi:ABC transporter ATP-binding protein [Microvirga terricola]|uniref:ATP-binding cassette domain-containing protein n=1 Tax=Microvirga terricola TaxID=2719797 RepID=A0ABX0V7N4_9HYPH|nr:oligopeptide/dipeptide ABC transporter ATP-binding protein [Microvirga terricola]NIX75857.1 ATP-binding cassette domain-containing protein [Microvirga terricola]